MAKSGTLVIKTIPLADAEVDGILDSLDNQEDNPPPSSRVDKRFPLRLKRCVIHIKQPGDASTSTYLVHTRNISKSGVAFLHGGYLHGGTRITIQLITTRGSWSDVEGEVVRCRFVEGRIHEVGARFERHVHPSDYTNAAIEYSVLVGENDDSIARLTSFHLEQLNVHADRAEDGRTVVEKALENGYDLIICDTELPKMDGLQAVKELRKQGYIGKIIITSSQEEERIKKQSIEAGSDSFLGKPYTREDLAGVLSGIAEEPLISMIQDEESIVPLIKSFVDGLPNRMRAIQSAQVAQQSDTLKKLICSIKEAGGAYGFEPIATAAGKVERAITDGLDASEVSRLIGELTKLCMSARCS